jgi:hypothetical protein
MPDREDTQRRIVSREMRGVWISFQARSESPERASHSSKFPRNTPINTGVIPSASWMLWVMVSNRLVSGACESETLPV